MIALSTLGRLYVLSVSLVDVVEVRWHVLHLFSQPCNVGGRLELHCLQSDP